MEKKRKSIQVYAIIVSIVAIVTFIICIAIMVSALINRSDPMNSGYSQNDLSSFQSYKLQVMRSVSEDQVYIPTEQELQEMYDSARNEKVNRVMHNTKRDIIVTGLLILISLVLFVVHWRIVKKSNMQEEL